MFIVKEGTVDDVEEGVEIASANADTYPRYKEDGNTTDVLLGEWDQLGGTIDLKPIQDRIDEIFGDGEGSISDQIENALEDIIGGSRDENGSIIETKKEYSDTPEPGFSESLDKAYDSEGNIVDKSEAVDEDGEFKDGYKPAYEKETSSNPTLPVTGGEITLVGINEVLQNHETRISALEATVGDANGGLVKDVADNTAAIGKESTEYTQDEIDAANDIVNAEGYVEGDNPEAEETARHEAGDSKNDGTGLYREIETIKETIETTIKVGLTWQ